MEMFINWFFLILSLGLLAYLIRNPPLKDWIIVLFTKITFTLLTDFFVVAYDLIEYPVRFLPHVFEISILFDVITFSTLCVLYNQMTYKDKLPMIILKAFLISIPIALLEWWFERNTELINFINWNIWITYFTLTLTFLFTRTVIAIIRHFSAKQKFS